MKLYKSIFAIILLIFLFNNKLYSVENKIILRIDNNIITSLDIQNEKKYLIALNPNIKELEQKKIYEISKNSLLREKIKKIELLKNTKTIQLEEKYLDQIIESRYKSLGLNTLNDFNEYLNINNIKIDSVIEKISIEAVWNQLIYAKFHSKVKINEENLKKKILLNKKKNITKELLLNEIVFNIENDTSFKKKYTLIKKSISEIGFQNTASIYSISDTSQIGGKLGWIKENSLNSKIKKEIIKLKPKQHTKPITIPGGFLIIHLSEIKIIKNETNIEEELKRIINLETNRQLNQYSTIFFNKIKKEIIINET
jgi:peptidyl-prolyl cis-trans isomerase SurA